VTSPTAPATRSIWQIDPAHTLVEFAVRHMMVSTVKGRFTGVKGTIAVDPANPAASTVEAEIDVKTVVTGADQRDQHLLTSDFFEVEKYPTITFTSTRIEPQGEERAKVYGNLTLHGVTKEVVLDTELTGVGKNPWGKEVAGFEGRTSISRKDFGLGFNVALETGGVLLGDTIRIEISVEANKAE
jgi:polyisoprenoid-binding protein YceI